MATSDERRLIPISRALMEWIAACTWDDAHPDLPTWIEGEYEKSPSISDVRDHITMLLTEAAQTRQPFHETADAVLRVLGLST